MIKEYIENLPGGKEFIYAQRILGMIIGSGLIFMMMIFVAMTTSDKYVPRSELGLPGRGVEVIGYSKDEVLFIMLVMGFISTLLIWVIGLITYYYQLNKADNSYMSKKSSDKS